MATGRFLKKEITTSERINSLSDKSALFYTWCIPFQDDFGLLPASTWKLKNTVVPGRKSITQGMIGEFIIEWKNLGLVCFVKINGETWLWFPDFEEKQTLKKDRGPQTYLGKGADGGGYKWSFYKEIPQMVAAGFQLEPPGIQMEDNGNQVEPELKGSEENRKERKGRELRVSDETPALTPKQITVKFFKQVDDLIKGKTDDAKELQEYLRSMVAKGAPKETLWQHIQEFYLYWTEKNKSGTKQRWEMQETFEVNRRLGTWFRRIKEFKKTTFVRPQYHPDDVAVK